MAFLNIKNVKMVGMAAGVPKQVMQTISTTDQYDAADFIATTGVKEKRSSLSFTTSDLSLPAAEQLIADLNWDKSEIEALVFLSQYRDYIFPATACILQDRLGLKKHCLAFDISLGCSGWVYGLSVISSMMQSGAIKKALLIVGDARDVIPEYKDQLFGDAATVTALEYVEGDAGFKFDLGTDGSGFEAIIKHAGGTRNPLTADALVKRKCEDGRYRCQLQEEMKGMDVFAFGITTAPKSVKKLAKEYSIDLEQVDYFLFHQANKMMNEKIRTKLKLPEEKVPYSIEHFGNTSSASIPLTIVTQLKDKNADKPLHMVACGFGVGLSWGTVELTVDQNFIISELQEIEEPDDKL